MERRLIDGNALKEAFEEDGHLSGYIEEYIDNCPTIEAEPVRHGRWGKQYIIGYDGIHPVWGKPCSKCGYETELYHPNYCPNCGCKMDEKEDGHD